MFQKAFKNGKKCSNVGKRVQICAYVIYEWPLSDDNDSMSSRLSNKSDKNLGDFEDENSVDEEMLHLAQSLQHHQVSFKRTYRVSHLKM